MEILAELLVQVVGWLIQLFAELLIQLFAESVFRVIGHVLKAPFQRSPTQPWVAAVGYAIFGAIAGAISLQLFPSQFIKLEWLRVLSLVVTPLAAGMIMGLIGAWRRRHERDTIRLESFSYGFCFAFGMALVRHLYAH
jgi:hypothetical protein